MQYYFFSGQNDIQTRRRSSILSNGGGILAHLSRSTLLSIFVVVLLIFLFCSSMYLVFRVDSLQRQVRISLVFITCSWHQKNETTNSPIHQFTNLKCCKMSFKALWNEKARLKMFFKVRNKKWYTIKKGF